MEDTSPTTANGFPHAVYATQHQISAHTPMDATQDKKIASVNSELTRLLLEANAIGIKVDDRRGMPGGGLYTSLRETPDEAKRILLKRLEELGLQIWPGKKFLN